MDVPVFRRTELVDREVYLAAEEHLKASIAVPFSVLAVGGYGRRELFPFSDVDLILLFEDEPVGESIKEAIGEFLKVLWDSSVKVSHSVRTVAECCRFNPMNLHLHISLLDVRLILGDASLYRKVRARLDNFYRTQGRKVLRELANLTRQRHAKFGNTVYHLEPNIKEGPGGVRDVHFVHWALQLAPEKDAFRLVWAELQESRTFLYRLRFFVQERSGRDNNLLSFELQDEAAVSLGTPVSPEEWMRIFYRHARTVSKSSLQALDLTDRNGSKIFGNLREWRDQLSDSDFIVSRNRVFLRNASVPLGSLRSVFDLFTLLGSRNVSLSWDAQRRLSESAASLDLDSERNNIRWREWHRLLGQPHASCALHEMQDSGFLSIALPAWHSVESLVVRDFFHLYTVDEHTLVAIKVIDDLVGDNPKGTGKPFRQLAMEEQDLAVVRMALLLHDIGKGTTPGDHVRGSLQVASRFLEAIGAPAPDRRTIEFLIAHHLDLSVVMNGRDLDDLATARYLSSQIGTLEELRKLTLLTYADVSAVNPAVMSPWRSEQLWKVYAVAAAQLTKELASDRIQFTTPSLVQLHSSNPGLASFLEGFPRRYERIHSEQQMTRHFELDNVRSREGVGIDIQREPGAYVATVVAGDHPGLFAAICGTLASFGLDIVKAEAASNSSGCVLDEFRFVDPRNTLELNPSETERLRSTLKAVVSGSLDVAQLLKRRRPTLRPKSFEEIPSSVRFDNDASDTSTLIDFVGEDRPGLLFDIASVLTTASCNIEVVLVNTEAHRAIDALYVTHQGGKLDTKLQEELSTRLTAIAGENI